MKYRIKATNEIIELRTWRRDDGAIKLVDKYGKMGFWPDEVEPAEHLGWHPASELPNMGEEVVTWVNHGDGAITVSRGVYVGWPEEIINKLRWCYPPKED